MPLILVVERAMDLVGHHSKNIGPLGSHVWRLRSQAAVDLFLIELAKFASDLIADLPENRDDVFLAACGLGWIGKSNMDSFSYLAHENGTVLVGVSTDRDDIVKRLAEKLPDTFRFDLGDVDAYFPASRELHSD